MSFKPDDVEHERTTEGQLEEIRKLLAGILTGIALINDLSPSQLLELSKGL